MTTKLFRKVDGTCGTCMHSILLEIKGKEYCYVCEEEVTENDDV